MGMDTTLAGRHALVCGASAGIGRAVAMALGARGARVTVLARRERRLAAVVEALRAEGALDPALLVADLDQWDQLEERARQLMVHRGPVHVLINNTGGPPAGPLLEAAPADFQRTFGRHVLAAHLLTQLAVPGMRAAGFGRIINIISVSVREPIPNLGVSNTIRGAMAAWAKSFSRELPPGITINNILPGYTDTERLTELREAIAERMGTSAESVVQGWLSTVPEGRLGRPEEVAAAAAFLASPAAAFVRGISLPVDGGRLMGI